MNRPQSAEDTVRVVCVYYGDPELHPDARSEGDTFFRRGIFSEEGLANRSLYSTRRFSFRPAAFLLSPTGLLAPPLVTVSLEASTPFFWR